MSAMSMPTPVSLSRGSAPSPTSTALLIRIVVPPTDWDARHTQLSPPTNLRIPREHDSMDGGRRPPGFDKAHHWKSSRAPNVKLLGLWSNSVVLTADGDRGRICSCGPGGSDPVPLFTLNSIPN